MNGVIEEWRDCEACGTRVPVHDLVRTWCDACGWNLSDPAPSRTVIERTVDALGALHGAWLLEQVIAAPETQLRPRLRVSTVLASALSLLIMAANLLVALAGLYLLVRGWPNVMLVALGLVLMLAGWFLRPRLDPLPPDCLERSAFPNLFSMVDGIAGQLSLSPIEHVRVDHQFNASMGQAGLARRPVLTIGLPLWASLTGQERVALIAHEMAHRVNRDPARGTVTGWGLSALDRWIYLLDPAGRAPQTLAEIAIHMAMRLLGAAAGGLRGLLARLLYLDSQRAEYLADHLAAKVAGPVATTKLLGKLGLGRNLQAVAERAYYGGDTDGRSVIDAFRGFVETVPEREMERIRRADATEHARIDASHPPTAARVTFIRSRHFELPMVILSDTLSRAIDDELQPLRERFSMKLMDGFIERPGS
ncbi:MAG: M48 family metalloprotease [Parvibaculaceae bacterium]